jgi:hypothetical protein
VIREEAGLCSLMINSSHLYVFQYFSQTTNNYISHFLIIKIPLRSRDHLAAKGNLHRKTLRGAHGYFTSGDITKNYFHEVTTLRITNEYYTSNIAKNFNYDEENDVLHIYFDTLDDCVADIIDGMIAWHSTKNYNQWKHIIIIDFSIFNLKIIDKIKITADCKNNIKALQDSLRRNMRENWHIFNSELFRYYGGT